MKLLWEMFDDMLECNECGGILLEPPKFTIPPPPRPPFLGEYTRKKCDAEDMLIQTLNSLRPWESYACKALPFFDARFISSHSWQMSAIVAVFTLLLFSIVISTIFVWKNRQKVKKFHSPTRGTRDELTYEDPDVFFGYHIPLVMRHHHNFEVLHGKSFQYPSDYPLTKSPLFLVSSSPGPDSYCSNGNIYEERQSGSNSFGESDAVLYSDDDLAGDKLSLPEKYFLNKRNEIKFKSKSNINKPTIYFEHKLKVSNTNSNSSFSYQTEIKNASSLLPKIAQISDERINNIGSAKTAYNARGLLPGILRYKTSRNKYQAASDNNPPTMNTLNTSSSKTATNGVVPPLKSSLI